MGYEDDRLLDSLAWAQHFALSCTTHLPSHLDRDDLQSAGVLGYLRAAERFDAARGASFRGYCAVRIRGAVLDELRRWDWAPRSIHKNIRKLTRITSNLTDDLDREPTRTELATALGMDEAEFAAYQDEAQPRTLISLNDMSENYQGEESISLMERLPDPTAERPDAGVLSAEDRTLMVKCLSALPASQAKVITLYYLRNIPLRDVARMMKVTPSRVSQLHHQALERLRQMWQRSHAE